VAFAHQAIMVSSKGSGCSIWSARSEGLGRLGHRSVTWLRPERAAVWVARPRQPSTGLGRTRTGVNAATGERYEFGIHMSLQNAFVARKAIGACDEFSPYPASACSGYARICRTKPHTSQLAFMRRIWGVTVRCDESVRAGCPSSRVPSHEAVDLVKRCDLPVSGMLRGPRAGPCES
jgi:hypothetical protein